MEESIIDDKATGGGGMEDGEFCVFDSCPEEVCNGVGTGMKGNSIKRGGLRPSSLEVYSVSNVVVSNIPCNFFFILFIDEDERVMFRIGCIIFDPILTWVVSLVFAVSD